jgi:hypothetical protein
MQNMATIQQAADDVWSPNKVVAETVYVLEEDQAMLRASDPPEGVNELEIPEWELEISALQNSTDEIFRRNMTANGARQDVPWLNLSGPHDGHAVMVGGGASVELQLYEIAERKAYSQTVFALNGAAKFLAHHGIVADYHVICDARPQNIHFLDGLHARRYLVSSMCDPSLFDYLVERGADVTMFHQPHPDLNACLSNSVNKGRNIVLVGGAITVGLVAMSAATAIGYRFLHLYGYDSSDSDDGRAHAYAQDRTAAESKRLGIICAGRKFWCSFAMFKQAEAFPRFSGMLAEFGCTITVHGDGLLPTMAREMTNAWPANAATCDLSKVPASFDFITWLVNAEMDRRRRGAPAPLKVAFVDGPDAGFRNGDVQNLAEKRQIMDRVMRPALALFGAEEDPNVIHGRQYHYWYRPITEAARTGEEVPKCKPQSGAVQDMIGWLINHGHRLRGKAPLVITLRETRYSPERNSNVAAWTEFARRRRAEGEQIVFVRDTARAEEPIEDFSVCPVAARDLHARAALYSLARCNLIIANGPAELLQFSDWPFIEIKPPAEVDPLRPVTMGETWWQRFGGITPPESFPWLGKHQMTVWKRDAIDVLETAWAEWLSANSERE